MKKNLIALAVTALASAAAFAADDPGITAINELSEKATTYIGAAFGVAVLVTGGMWGIRMMKKAFGKAG